MYEHLFLDLGGTVRWLWAHFVLKSWN